MTNLTEKLAQSVSSWGARLAYGETSIVGGRELVPVAFVGFGFGAGEATGDAPDGESPAGGSEGSGGGGGFAVPVGAYVGGPDGLAFHPNPVTVVLVLVPLVSAVGVALAQIVRASHTRATG